MFVHSALVHTQMLTLTQGYVDAHFVVYFSLLTLFICCFPIWCVI